MVGGRQGWGKAGCRSLDLRVISLMKSRFQAHRPATGLRTVRALVCREMMEAGEAVLLMSDVPPELPRVRQLLQSALQQAEAAAAGAAAAERRAAAAAPAAAPSSSGASPSGGAPTRAAAGAGAASGGSVDVGSLARALAAAMAGSGGSGAAGAGTAGARPTAGGTGAAAGRQRIVRVTPRKLARVLERCLAEVGIGQVSQQAQQQQQADQGGGQP